MKTLDLILIIIAIVLAILLMISLIIEYINHKDLDDSRKEEYWKHINKK